MARMRVCFWGWLWLCSLFCVVARAQDQVEVIDDPLVVLSSAVPSNPRLLTYTEAKALIEATLQQKYPSMPKLVDDPNFYCIIHTVVWKQPSSSTDKPEVEFKKWYVFRGAPQNAPQWDQLQLEGTRLFGSHKVAVLAVHWTQSVVVPTETEISTFAKNDATAITSIKNELARGPISRFTDSNGKALEVQGGVVYVRGYPPTIPTTYRVEVTQKTAAPWAHLLQLLAGVTQAGGQKLQNRVLPVWAGQIINIRYTLIGYRGPFAVRSDVDRTGQEYI